MARARGEHRPRWSRLAWITFGLGVVPTLAGQLLAPLLGFAAWLEIRAAKGRQRGRALVLVGVAAAAAWAMLGIRVLAQEWDALAQAQAAEAASDAPCRARMGRLAEAWAQAALADPAGLSAVDDAEVLPWLVAQGYVEADALRCPLDRGLDLDPGPGAAGSFRFLSPLPARVSAPAECVVLYEARAAHRRDGRRGRNVVFGDHHAEFVPEELFRQVLARQRAAAARARNQ